MQDLFSAPEAPAVPIEEYAERAYLAYAISVVKGRALPELADGQKPVQRRILYAMREMRLTAESRPVKSARVVGEVLGKFHPHGDNSAYEAMVRLAQDFSLRYPLIDGHGNFGSRDGDGAAAMRYTEARLAPIAELLLSELDAGTVDFVPNYDGAFDEPRLLPARLPFTLLNGATGIAVGMATDIPSHNLPEVAEALVALIRKPDLDLDGIMQHIPGPDFPGGGQIISGAADIRAVYETGRGSIRTRARWRVEDQARGQKRIIVFELPPGSSTKSVMDDIERVTNPQPKPGKKSVGATETALKQKLLSLVEAVRDEADQSQPVRLVIEPRSSRTDLDELMELLCAHTGLETGVATNLVMIGLDGRPRQRELRGILKEWLGFRFDVVTRRSRHRLAEVERRIHILEGRMIAYLNIDEVIRVIREADDPKADLIAAFDLTEIQAEDILEIRLRQLARLEGIRIEKELASLCEERDGLNELLGSPEAMKKLIIGEIRTDAKKFGDDRRTIIEAVRPALAKPVVLDEAVTIILSRKGWIRSRVGHGVELGNLGFKEGDGLLAALETRTVRPLVLLDAAGRAYTLDPALVPGGRGDGVPVASLVELVAPVSALLSGQEDEAFLFVSLSGHGFVARLGQLVSRQRSGKAFMTTEGQPGVRALGPVAADDHVHLLTRQGRLLVFPLGEVRELPRGKGVQLIALEEGDELLDLCVAPAGTVSVCYSRSGRETRKRLAGEDLQTFLGHRARKGSLLPPRCKPLALERSWP